MMTTPETNKAAYRRLHDATNSRDLKLISQTVDEVFHPDAVFHAKGPVGATAPEAVKGAWAMLLRAFPDSVNSSEGPTPTPARDSANDGLVRECFRTLRPLSLWEAVEPAAR